MIPGFAFSLLTVFKVQALCPPWAGMGARYELLASMGASLPSCCFLFCPILSLPLGRSRVQASALQSVWLASCGLEPPSRTINSAMGTQTCPGPTATRKWLKVAKECRNWRS